MSDEGRDSLEEVTVALVRVICYVVGKVDSEVFEVVWSTLEETWDLGPVVDHRGGGPPLGGE